MSSTPLRRRVLGTLRAYLCLRCCVFCSRNAAAGQDGSTADTNDNQQESIGNAQNSGKFIVFFCIFNVVVTTLPIYTILDTYSTFLHALTHFFFINFFWTLSESP